MSWAASFPVATTLAANLGHGGIARAVTGIAETPLFVALVARPARRSWARLARAPDR